MDLSKTTIETSKGHALDDLREIHLAAHRVYGDALDGGRRRCPLTNEWMDDRKVYLVIGLSAYRAVAAEYKARHIPSDSHLIGLHGAIYDGAISAMIGRYAGATEIVINLTNEWSMSIVPHAGHVLYNDENPDPSQPVPES